MALNNMGGAHMALHRYDDARKQFILSASFFRSANTPAWEAQALENLAAAEIGMGNPRAAVESYGRGLQIWQQQDRIDRQAMILSRIAGLHASAGEARSAIELYNRAITLAQKSNNVVLEASNRGSLGRVHFEAGNWPAARLELDHGLRLFRECGDKRGQASTLMALGKLDLATGAELLRSAAAMFHEVGDAPGERAALDLLPEGKDSRTAKEKPA
jgi:tetratricopeptide (TPR) repeat protein